MGKKNKSFNKIYSQGLKITDLTDHLGNALDNMNEKLANDAQARFINNLTKDSKSGLYSTDDVIVKDNKVYKRYKKGSLNISYIQSTGGKIKVSGTLSDMVTKEKNKSKIGFNVFRRNKSINSEIEVEIEVDFKEVFLPQSVMDIFSYDRHEPTSDIKDLKPK